MLDRNIYFVRHGETLLNAARTRQGESGGLSDTGKEQVKALSEKLSHFGIKSIFCSPFQRALETADIISQNINCKIEYTPLLCERRNPTSIIGKSYDDIHVQEIIDSMDKSFHAADFRIGDEENFEDLKARAIKAKIFLEKNSSSSTLCITHGIFLKMLLAVMLFGEGLTVEQYIRLSVFNPADNAGITVVKYRPYNFFSKPWEIVAYNDTPVSTSSLKI